MLIKKLWVLSLGVGLLGLAGCASSRSGERANVDKTSPQYRAGLLIEASQSALLEKDISAVFRYLQQAEQIDPKRSDIYHMRALAYTAKQDTPNALLQMKKAHDIDPRNASINNTYGKILMDANQQNEAQIYLKSAASDPTFSEAYKPRTSLGIIQYRKGNYGEARREFSLAVQEKPQLACIANFYLGHIEMKYGNLRSATLRYEKATQKICAGFPDAHYALGVAFERQKRFDLAKRKYLEVRQNFPESKVSSQAVEKLRNLE